MSFTIPAQQNVPVIEVIVPGYYVSDTSGNATSYSLYRNGVLLAKVSSPAELGYMPLYGDHATAYIDFPLRYVDYQAPAGQALTYRVVVVNGQYKAQIWGTAFVNCRKK